MYGRGKKPWEGDRDNYGDQRGPSGSMEGEQGVRTTRKRYLGDEKARK